MDEQSLRFISASKITEGLKLTEEQFEIAKKYDMLDKKITYGGYLASYYTSPSLIGMICPLHTSRLYSKPGLNQKKYTCGFGLHLDELDRNYLTDANRYYIYYYFGSKGFRLLKKGDINWKR
jgi:hypothetical protein